jgi:hypothetical protein
MAHSSHLWRRSHTLSLVAFVVTGLLSVRGGGASDADMEASMGRHERRTLSQPSCQPPGEVLDSSRFGFYLHVFQQPAAVIFQVSRCHTAACASCGTLTATGCVCAWGLHTPSCSANTR